MPQLFMQIPRQQMPYFTLLEKSHFLKEKMKFKAELLIFTYVPREKLQERKVKFETSANYAFSLPFEASFNFSPDYEPERQLQRRMSVFDRMGPL